MGFYSGIQDFGWCDKILAKKNERVRLKAIGDTEYVRTDIDRGADGSEWIVFLPWRMTFNMAEKIGILPKEGKIFVYEGPAGLANPDPKHALRLLDRLMADIAALKLPKFNVLSFSIGNYPGFFAANHFETGRFVSVLPGSKLGACIYDGIATGGVKSRSVALGLSKSSEYDSVISGTNPIENLGNLPTSFEIHVAQKDYFIPTRYAEELLVGIENQGLTPEIVRYKNKGHVLALLQFGQEKGW